MQIGRAVEQPVAVMCADCQGVCTEHGRCQPQWDGGAGEWGGQGGALVAVIGTSLWRLLKILCSVSHSATQCSHPPLALLLTLALLAPAASARATAHTHCWSPAPVSIAQHCQQVQAVAASSDHP